MNSYLIAFKKTLKRLLLEGRLYKIEPLIFSKSFDVWQRYSEAIKIIRSMSDSFLSILEVGAGGSGITGWLDNSKSLFVTLVDLNFNRLKRDERLKNCEYVIADGCQLPFVDYSFHMVISLATLEHIHRKNRIKFADNLKRVAKKKVIIYAPIAPVAKIGDERFFKTHKRLFRTENRQTMEHMMFGQPTLRELKEMFPGCSFKLFQNLIVWYITMILARLRIIGWLTGLLYVTILHKVDKKPPFYGCILSWDKLKEGNTFESNK
ncbi:MAG: class I SAM-dependent methyltransferase [Nitrososphaerota archaeon]